MPNANTISRLVGGPSPSQGSLAIPSVVPTGTSAFIVLNQLAGAAVLTAGNAPSQPTGAQTFGSYFDGFPFKVRVSWKVTTKASNNLTIAIVQGSTTTYAAGNVIATTGAVANNTGNYNGWLEANVLWDSTVQKLSGYYVGYTNAGTPAIVDITTLTNQVAVTSQAGLVFGIAAKFFETTNGNTMTITEF